MHTHYILASLLSPARHQVRSRSGPAVLAPEFRHAQDWRIAPVRESHVSAAVMRCYWSAAECRSQSCNGSELTFLYMSQWCASSGDPWLQSGF